MKETVCQGRPPAPFLQGGVLLSHRPHRHSALGQPTSPIHQTFFKEGPDHLLPDQMLQVVLSVRWGAFQFIKRDLMHPHELCRRIRDHVHCAEVDTVMCPAHVYPVRTWQSQEAHPGTPLADSAPSALQASGRIVLQRRISTKAKLRGGSLD